MTKYTREQILSMPAGRELDALVAEKVMGYELTPSIFFDDLDKSKTYYCTAGSPGSEEINAISYLNGSWTQYTFNPSESISAAWEVVEKMLSNGVSIQLDCEGDDYAFWIKDGTDVLYEYGKTAPEAICKASLLAVMGL